MSLNTDEEINLIKGDCSLCRAIVYDDDPGHVVKNGSLFCSESCAQEAIGDQETTGKQYQIVIEGSNYQEVYNLFETIQNKHNFYDNCIFQEVDPDNSIVDPDRTEETGSLSWDPQGDKFELCPAAVNHLKITEQVTDETGKIYRVIREDLYLAMIEIIKDRYYSDELRSTKDIKKVFDKIIKDFENY